jgi:DNA-binding MarR family transcriptional regulator
MQLHENDKISPKSTEMTRKPSQEATFAWTRLLRVQQSLLAAVENDLKASGFPPLAWYDALLELARAENGMLRPLELEKRMLLPQYSTSRLVDRLADAGLVERKICPVDGRGQYVVITPSGRNLQKKMWDTYSAAIERHLGAKLSNKEAASLCDLLGRLA